MDTAIKTNDAGAGGSKSATRYLPAVARVLVGLMFLLFGLNGFFNFIPPPKEPMPESVMQFMGSFTKAGYMWVVAGTEIIVAALLLLNRFVPLALALLAPIVVGILTFHIFLAPASIVPGLVVLALELYLAWSYRSAFRPMLAARNTPGAK
jgi:uncharacterized membrane protein YphA (DoxX/SURF4 family)